jgi:zinc protease
MNHAARLGVCIVLAAGSLLGQQERFRKNPPPPEPLQQDLRLPPLAPPSVLSNGLKVSVAFRESGPFWNMELVINAGESVSPDFPPGLATYVASLLNRGTQIHSPADIEEIVESLGGSFAVKSNQDDIVISFHFLSEHFDEALDLLAQMLLQPRFLEKEIANVKRTLTYDLQEKEKSPEFVAKRLLVRLLFKDHPYEKLAFTREALKSWTPKDILEFFDRFYRPNNAHLIITGNLNVGSATRKVSHYLNTWQSRNGAPEPPPKKTKLPAAERICLIDVPQSKFGIIYLGTVLPVVGIQERFALTVLNQVLGGTTNSRLFMNLRETKEYANFAFSEVDFFRAAGAFLVRARVRPDVVVPALQEIKKEIRGLATDPVPAVEVEPAKTYLLGNFPLSLERPDAFSQRIAEILAMGGGEEFWNGYYEQIMLVNSERVFEAARKYLLQPLIVVIAGDRNVLGERLSTIESYDVYDAKGQFQFTVTKEKKGAD